MRSVANLLWFIDMALVKSSGLLKNPAKSFLIALGDVSEEQIQSCS